MKAHPDIPITGASWVINTATNDSDALWKSFAELHRSFPDFADKKGISGYYYLYPNRYVVKKEYRLSIYAKMALESSRSSFTKVNMRVKLKQKQSGHHC
jgi:hypothetical protein